MGARDQPEPIEHASREALRELQLERLKKTLHQAYQRIPHYKKKFAAAGVHPADLKELSDLAKSPFTSKDDLRLPPATRPMRRIERIKGRSDDMIIIRGVNVFPSQIEAVLGREPQLAPHDLLEVRGPHTRDEFEVLAEMRPELCGKLGAEEISALAQKAQHLIKGYIGITATMRVLEPGTIERSQGKAKRVIDRRPKA